MAEPIKKSALTEGKKLLAEEEPPTTAASSPLMVSPPTEGQGSAPGPPDIFRERLENIGDIERRLVAFSTLRIRHSSALFSMNWTPVTFR